ncbi:hypothetical protein L21SP2_0014 [Salinispira pacifica]|uniref:Uncharacterized protein n=1 Tax=Salinispira pacifica TaxID=1307761 RepID=V5WCX8_9SPIO|nr:hypothetical protein L21SP2_0014 [Salinispira pacifica]
MPNSHLAPGIQDGRQFNLPPGSIIQIKLIQLFLFFSLVQSLW